jgi:uncharacterized radical SAM superfamily protein
MLKEIEEVKIGLMTHGMKVSESARKGIEGNAKRPLTLADYASTSGISMKLEGDVWVNAPINDFNANFVKESPYSLDYVCNRFVIKNMGIEVTTDPIPVPNYYNKSAESGEPFRNLAITHTDRVRISPIGGCAITCDFCDLPFEYKYRTKRVDDLVESVSVALKDDLQRAKHVLISGGTPRKKDYRYENDVYGAVASAFPGVDVDIMMVPMKGLLDINELKKKRIKGLSINLELWNEEIREKVLHGKGSLTRDEYLDFIEEAVPVFGEGNVRSLLMVGIEPMEDTLRAVDALAERGCDPVLSPFRPDPSTPMRNERPPNEKFLIETYQRARDIVEKIDGVKLGPRCIPCMHNTLTFPDDSGKYYYTGQNERPN